ncbi:MAG TPA: tetratricopeptide repeat protein [Candidatus Sulfotelmatobacter sp.]|nr:tetratricopeptide repeat protein [Candidatus Sulfotelmatobacter sp.]
MQVGFRSRIALADIVLMSMCSGLLAQVGENRRFQTPQSPNSQAASDQWDRRPDAHAEEELQKGTALTRAGLFAEAIPHLRAALGRVSNDYAASFNLSLCFVATGQPKLAIPILTALRDAGRDNVDVNNLLAQAYVGDGQNQKALEALQKASTLAPENEKLFLFVADACMDQQEYALGLKVVDLGLGHLPESAQLHYQHGMFLVLLDELDASKKDFDLTRALAPDTDIAYLAGTQKAMLVGDVPEALRIAREAVKKGNHDYRLLTLLGEALLRSGIAPGEPEFKEAQEALEKAVAARPAYAGSQLALGKLALLSNQVDDAIAHLEIARELSPNDASVYSNLAAAYRKRGDLQKAQDMLAVLANMNQVQAERFRSAPEDQKPGYTSSGTGQSQAPKHP